MKLTINDIQRARRLQAQDIGEVRKGIFNTSFKSDKA